jgi:branched-chain amino acid transport system substrate-binding protein
MRWQLDRMTWAGAVVGLTMAASLAAPARAADQVILGAVLPLTGSSATVGEDQRRGIELAVEYINSRGGVLGKSLKVIIEDSGGRAASAIDAATKLASVDKVPVIIGEYSSGITIPMGQYLVRQGVVHINPGSSSPKVRDIGEYSFSVMGLDDLAGRFTADKIFKQGFRKAVFLAPNNAYGEGVTTQVAKAFTALGGTVVGTVLYTEGQSTYRRELEQLAKAAPDVYVYTAYGQESAVINREAFELGLNKTPWFGIYLTMCTSDSAPETVQGQTGIEVNYIGPDGGWYKKLYEDKHHQPFTTTFSGYTFDAVNIAVAAIKKANSTDPAAIRDALKQVAASYVGVTGPLAMDEQRQRAHQPFLSVKYVDKAVETIN